MILSKLELVEQMLFDKDIKLFKTKEPLKAAAIKIDKSSAVFINYDLLETYQEKTVALLHEYYHLEYDALYTFNDSLQTRKRREYKANKALVLENIPVSYLQDKVQKGYLKHEIAEELCITEELLDEAFRIYKNMGEM